MRHHHLANKYVHIRETKGPTLGVIQTGSQNQRNPNAPRFEERSIEWTLSMEEEARKTSWIFRKNVCKVPGSCSEKRNKFFKTSPASNVSSPSITTSKEIKFIVGSGASLHIKSESELTPEEQETIQKSKDPPVVLTANGTTHMTEEATVYVCGLDMIVQVQLLEESSAELSLGKLSDKNGYSHEWQRCQPSYLIKNGRNTDGKTTAEFLWWSQACKQPNTRPPLWATESWHKLWATTSDVWEQNCRNGFNHSRKD